MGFVGNLRELIMTGRAQPARGEPLLPMRSIVTFAIQPFAAPQAGTVSASGGTAALRETGTVVSDYEQGCQESAIMLRRTTEESASSLLLDST